MKTFTAWSPSRLATYDECPAKAKWKLLDKLCPTCFKGEMKGWDPATCQACGKTEATSPQLERGKRMHASAEQYVSGREPSYAAEMEPVKDLLERFKLGYKAGTVRVEFELAINKAWQAVGYFAKDCWARFKLDVLEWETPRKLGIYDWKSGREKKGEDYNRQMSGYCTAALAVGIADEVQATLVFVDQNSKVPSLPALKENLPALKAEWEGRVAPMMADTTFAPRPGNGCRSCEYSRNRGGPCQF